MRKNKKNKVKYQPAANIHSEKGHYHESNLNFSDNRPSVATQRKQIGAIKNHAVLQRVINTTYGTFTDEKYDFNARRRKLLTTIKFNPNNNVNATKIGLVQSIKASKNGTPTIKEPAMVDRVTTDGVNVDRIANRNNPVYGADALAATDDLSDTGMTNNRSAQPTELNPDNPRNATYQLGYRRLAGGAWQTQEAGLYDGPTVGNLGNNGGKIFETTAMVLEGNEQGAYLGSVSWGARTDGAGVLSKEPFAKASDGVPTNEFLKAAEAWNGSRDRGSIVVKNANIPVLNKGYTLAMGTQLTWAKNIGAGGIAYVRCTVDTGPHATDVVEVAVTDLEDMGNGGPHKPLPSLSETLITEIGRICQKDDWADKVHLSYATKPAGVTAMIAEINSAHTPDVKLVNIRNIANGKTGWTFTRDNKTREFYQNIARIPANVNLYELATTAQVTKDTIANHLYNVVNYIRGFTF